jgi:hypothetical protein
MDAAAFVYKLGGACQLVAELAGESLERVRLVLADTLRADVESFPIASSDSVSPAKPFEKLDHTALSLRQGPRARLTSSEPISFLRRERRDSNPRPPA